MAQGSDKTAKFSIELGSDAAAVAKEGAVELERLRSKIKGATDEAKRHQEALRALRGSSDEVKAAKERLQARINSEKDTISRATLDLLKHGATLKKTSTETKAALAPNDNLRDVLKGVGVPVDDLSKKLHGLDEALTTGKGAAGLATSAIVGIGAAVVGVTAVLVAGATSLLHWIVSAADAARSAQLMREAFLGSAQNATNLGTQVTALAKKVSLSKGEINELALQLTRTRLSGGAIVDTLNAVGQASDAMGKDVGRSMQDILTRGARLNRLQINPLELQGTGLQFQDIAANLAKELHVSMKDAQAALFEGRVKLDAGAKAVRSAIEARFAKINLRKAMSLDVQAAKFKETLGELVSGVNIEPLLRGFQKIGSVFEQSSVSGAALKQLVTIIGTGLGKTFEAVAPIAKQFIKGLVLGALEVAIAFFRSRNAIRDAFGGESIKGVDLMTIALKSALGPMRLIEVSIVHIAGAIVGLKKLSGAAANIGQGIGKGIDEGGAKAISSVGELADKVTGAFTDKLGIHSPSEVFKKYGEQTSAGYKEGLDRSAGASQGAAEALAPPAPRGGSGAVAGGSSSISNVFHLNFNVSGGAGRASEAVKTLSQPSFLRQLTKAVEEALVTAGIPTQAKVTP